jgi:SpoVK/Ycf46/Vps4 family AAA+-type ATPase
VQGRTKFFLENREWYDKKGIPYTLGFLFHGPPGCGKTSSVKAIANEGKRHIINVQLSEIKTKSQLQHLFFNDEIHVYNGLNTEKYTIPVSERLYVIEDIDAMGDTVLRREWKKPTAASVPKTEEDAWLAREKEAEKETLDLSFLLNLLDGTLEANGRILVLTTNFPERIDRALIRPGRIDMIVKFKKCNRVVLQEMVDSFYDKSVELPEDASLDYKWSPAEVNQILFRNFTTPEQAVHELTTFTQDDLCGFVDENGSEDLQDLSSAGK